MSAIYRLINWVHIFSCVWPFYEWAVSNLDRSMHRSLWVWVAHGSFVEGSHTTKNMASGSVFDKSHIRWFDFNWLNDKNEQTKRHFLLPNMACWYKLLFLSYFLKDASLSEKYIPLPTFIDWILSWQKERAKCLKIFVLQCSLWHNKLECLTLKNFSSLA